MFYVNELRLHEVLALHQQGKLQNRSHRRREFLRTGTSTAALGFRAT
jgi:hypothetical protein